MAHMGTETTYMAYILREAVVMAHVETEETHMAYAAGEAVWFSRMERCEATHNAEAASEAFRDSSRRGDDTSHMAYPVYGSVFESPA